MNREKLEHLIKMVSRGDTSAAEKLFSKPGGRKYLESMVLVVVSSLPDLQDEKEDLFIAFLKVLDKIEVRIKRQKEGEKILKQLYPPA
jgi:ribosome-associated translation inhibitor RaiA